MDHESWITKIYLADGNPMFDIYGNPPNHPVLMRLPAPTQVRNELSKVICVSKDVKSPLEFTIHDFWQMT